MDWKTNNSADGKTVRVLIGLQFFAEDGESADMDGFERDFLAGLNGEDGPEDQRDAEPETNGGSEGAPEDQRGAEQQDEPKENEPREEEQQPQTFTQPVETVPLVYNGQQILLPADAVQALTSALGQNPVELLQKGMNYDHKGEREFRLLDQYAEASGMSRQQYLEQLERSQNEQMLVQEIEKCKNEFPDTPEAALQEIAKGRMAARRAAEQQQAQQRQAELAQMQNRIDQTVQQAKQDAEIRAWDEYERLAGVHDPKDVPERVMQLVREEGMTPVAAHWRYQSELAQQQVEIEKKNVKNKQTSPGSVGGTGENSGFEADFLKAFRF